MILRHTATKYGMVVEQIEATNTTRICQHCNHLNPSTNREAYQCGSCGVVVDQDQNGAVNLSRFAADPSLLDAAQRFALGY
jgi:transposase